MRDGKALQMGTSHELGQNFAKAFDIDYLSAERQAGALLDHVVGLVDPDGRRADHVPRRRQRPARAARGWRRSRSQVMVVKDGEGVLAAAERLRDDARRRGVRVGLDDRVDVPFGRRAVDAELQGHTRSGSRSARATWPPATWCWSAALDGSQDADAARRRGGRGRSPRSRPTSRRSTTAARRPQDARTADVKTLAEAIEAAGDRLGPGAVGEGRRGRRGRGERGRRHGALPDPRRTARCRDRGRAGPGRLLARSY